jgi:hypothetical protein
MRLGTVRLGTTRDVVLLSACSRYLPAGGSNDSGGSSISGTSILTLRVSILMASIQWVL